MASDNNRPLNSKSKHMVYSLSGCCLKIKRSLLGSVLKKSAEATGVIRTTVARIRLEKSEKGRFVIPDGSEGGAM